MSETYLKVAESHWFTDKSLQKNAQTNNYNNNKQQFLSTFSNTGLFFISSSLCSQLKE